MSWNRGLMLAFDLETTGISVENDRIVTACTALIDGSGKTPPKVRQWIANPGIDIPEGATKVHGITTEHAQKNGQEPALVIAEILAELHDAWEAKTPLVIFNSPYDLTLLDREARRYGGPTLSKLCGGDDKVGPVIDPYVIDKEVSRRRGSRKLIDQCEHYGVRLDGAHDATQDALAAARVAWTIAKKFPRYGEMDLQVLHRLQVQAKREQAESFRDYLKKQGKPYDDVRPEWPLVPFEGQAAIA
jgi:DNA polymerase-3 subunit epsilon